MCCEAGLVPLNSAFSAPVKGYCVLCGPRGRESPAVRAVSLSRLFGCCCLAGGPSSGLGSIESGCNEMRRPLGEQIQFTPAGGNGMRVRLGASATLPTARNGVRLSLV